jgi:hypothetical protein
VDWNALAPLDDWLLSEMTECETLFMAIVNRLEEKRSIPYLTRKLWYLRHVQFWNDYITRRKINLYLSAWIPHEIPDIVIYFLCKRRGIPMLYFDITIFRDTAFVSRDIRHACSALGERYGQLLAERPSGDPATLPLQEPFASYEQSLLSPQGITPPLVAVYLPSYWQQLHSLLIGRPLKLLRHAARFLTPGAWLRVWSTLKRSRVIHAMERFYDAHAAAPDLTRKFVYLPLHYQPESATLPMGGVFADQILIARLLNATLPNDVLIYVKEHPKRSYWLNRSILYYQDFLQLKKVRFVPRDLGTFTLREHCRAVATVTGSAGFENLFRGKPTLLFGSCYYQYAKGVFPVRTLEDCRSAVEQIFVHGAAPTPWSTHLYLKAMQDTRVAVAIDPWYSQISQLPAESHKRALAERLLKEVEALRGEIEAVKT